MRRYLKAIGLAFILSLLMGDIARANAYHPLAVQGWNMILRGDYEGGRKAIHKAIREEPNSFKYAFAMAKSYWLEAEDSLRSGNFEEARRIYMRAETYVRIAMEKATDDDEIYDAKSFLAGVFIQRKKFDSACEVLDEITTPASDSFHHYLYGLCLRFRAIKNLDQSLLEKSSHHLAKSIEGVDPLLRPLAFYFLGIDALNSNDEERATSLLTQWLALADHPSRSVILYDMSNELMQDARYLLAFFPGMSFNFGD